MKYDADPAGSGDEVGDGIPLGTTAYSMMFRAGRFESNLMGSACLPRRALNIPYIGYLELAETYLVTYQYDVAGKLITRNSGWL